MPDQDTAVIEQAPPAPATPAAAPETLELSGTAKLMADMERAAATPETKPETKPREEAPKPTTPKAEPETKAAAKPPDKPTATPPKEDAGTLRKRLAEVANSEKTLRQEIEAIKKQNQELANRRVVTPEMEAEIEANKKQIEEYRQRISEVAYEKSDDFHRDYRAPWDRLLAKSVKAVTNYRIEADDGSARAGTPADFWKVAGAHPAERAAIARQLFGDNFPNVLADIRALDELKEKSDLAIEQHRNGWQHKQKAEQERREGLSQTLSRYSQQYRTELVERYADYFGESADDPESTEALKQGLAFVDRAADQYDQPPPSDPAKLDKFLSDQAATAEVVRARAGWFLRGHMTIKRKDEKIKSLEAELAKYRKADPGGGEAPDARQQPVTATEEKLGVDALSEMVERAARME